MTGRAVAGLVSLALAIGLVAVARRDAPLGGEPFAVARVEPAPAPLKPPTREVPSGAHEAVGPPIASAAQVEAASGVKVTRGGAGPPKALIIDVARALGARPESNGRPGETSSVPPAQSNP